MILTIQALNHKGREALQKHVDERAKISKFNPQKIIYDKLFEEKIISKEPFMLQIKIKNPMLSSNIKFSDLRSQIEKAMQQNNATPEDYIIQENKE